MGRGRIALVKRDAPRANVRRSSVWNKLRSWAASHLRLVRILPMSTQVTVEPRRKHTPYVPETMEMKEFTFRALLIGLVMTAILGSANAYLGLKAGMTIAATYPAAVIGMALLRLMKGSLLEENIARTVGSIGESVAAGAVFTIPAFVMAGLWPGLTRDNIGIRWR